MTSFRFLHNATMSSGAQKRRPCSFNVHAAMLFSHLHVRSSDVELAAELEAVGCGHLSTSSLFLLQREDAIDVLIVLTVLIAADVDSFL